MKSIIHPGFLSFFLCSLFCSCSIEEGVGGTASITGTVIVNELDNTGNVTASYPASEERVYIVYGTSDFYDDDVRTHYTGAYKFEFLRKGTYSIYAYSECSGCPGKVEPTIIAVEITSRGEDLIAPEIIIIK